MAEKVQVSLQCEEDGTEVVLGGPGEYTIGRGALMKITDKRVSRNHALLRLEDNGAVEICPKHTVPFLHKSSDMEKFQVIDRNACHTVEDGDQISLLPNELIYSIKLTRPSYTTPTTLSTEQSATKEVKGIIKATPTLPSTDSSNIIGTEIPATSFSGTVTTPTTDVKPSVTSGSLDGGSTGRKRILPSWMMTSTGTGNGTTNKTTKKPKRERSSSTTVKRTTMTTTGTTTAATGTTMAATGTTTTGPLPVVPSATVTDTITSSTSVTGTVTGTTSLSSSDYKHASKVDDNGSKDGVSETKKKLPLCPYGKKCYRKNPVHLKEYSHEDDDHDDEGDDDSGDGGKPECPYGTSCYRQNPAHKKQFKHTRPPATTGTKRTRTSTRTKTKKSVLSGDSDDEGQPNVYDYNDSFIDDEEEMDDGGSSSTSFRGDSEDEDWHLPAGDEEEDVGELAAEAKEFMDNTKMHRPM